MCWLNGNRILLTVFGIVAVTVLGGGSVKADFTFGEVVNMGPVINSNQQESGPCISADGLEFYFHSNRDGGVGSYGPRRARRQMIHGASPQIWGNWSIVPRRTPIRPSLPTAWSCTSIPFGQTAWVEQTYGLQSVLPEVILGAHQRTSVPLSTASNMSRPRVPPVMDWRSTSATVTQVTRMTLCGGLMSAGVRRRTLRGRNRSAWDPLSTVGPVCGSVRFPLTASCLCGAITGTAIRDQVDMVRRTYGSVGV